MNIPQLKKLLCTLGCTLLTLGLASGCADHVSERSGTHLDVVPLTYTIGIKIQDGKQAKANEKLAEFTDKYWQIIVEQGATISWRTHAGESLAQQYYGQLASRGVNTSDLILAQMQPVEKNSLKNENGTGHQKLSSDYFDLEVKTTVHKIISDVCQYPKVGHYDELNDGCTIEANRWKSMVHPEKMLDNPMKNTLQESI